MRYGSDDPETIENITRNIMQVSLMQKERTIKNEAKKKEFLDQIQELFAFVNQVENYLTQKKSIIFLDPSSITSSIELVADASNLNKHRMSRVRQILIWRLNSPSSYKKKREVVSDLTFKYVEYFWDCYSEHYAGILNREELLEYAMMGMQSQASSSFANFIQNKLAPSFHKKQKEYEQMQKGSSKINKGPVM